MTDRTVDGRAGRELSALTGWPEAPPAALPEGLLDRLDALAVELGRHVGEDVAWERLFVERADRRNFTRSGRTSANGTCRLVRAADGWFALNLARPEDHDGLGALIGMAGPGWTELERVAAKSARTALVGRARLLGMPAAALATPSVVVGGTAESVAWWDERVLWPASDPHAGERPRVVDLSSLWAGPLACSLLQRAGADVVKVQGASRPDPLVATPSLYRSLHPQDQQCETIDFTTGIGRRRLRNLVESADVVVEASRPRALEQLGCAPESLPDRPGRVWLSITGYGRSEPCRDWVAFGDDAAVAGGLVGWDAAGEPVFCGDAVADPLTGLVGALAVLRALRRGGGVLLDVAMARCAAAARGVAAPPKS